MKFEIIDWPKNYCTYKECAELYMITEHYIKKFAKDAHAIVRLGSKRLNLVDRRILEDYMKNEKPLIRGYQWKDEQRKEQL